MANEIQFNSYASKTMYCIIRNSTGLVWNVNTSAFEVYSVGNITDYDVTSSEQGTATGYYTSSVPVLIPAGVYSVTAKYQLTSNPDVNDITVAVGDIQWNGANIIPLSSLSTSGQVASVAPIKISRGTMVQNFPFKLVSAADHITPFLSGVISGLISRDGNSFGQFQSGAYTEIGNGWYSLQALTSGDLLANSVILFFSAVGPNGGISDPRDMSYILQRTSGQ